METKKSKQKTQQEQLNIPVVIARFLKEYCSLLDENIEDVAICIEPNSFEKERLYIINKETGSRIDSFSLNEI